MSKILIVDDEKIIRNLLSKRLSEEGYRIEIAENGKEAFKKIKESRPDLIILDLSMPVMNGFEFLRVIEKEEDFSEIPVIALSNSGEKIEIEKISEMGVDDYIIKTEFSLRKIINKVISKIEDSKK